MTVRVFIALACLPLAAQTTLSLQEAGARTPNAASTPVHLGQRVILQGTVNSTAFHFPDYSLLAIDDSRYGAIVHVAGDDTRLDGFRPGDEIRVEGTIALLAGMVVLTPDRFNLLGRKTPPAPLDVPIGDLETPRYMGRLVRTESRIKDLGPTSAGKFFSVKASGPYKIFIPQSRPEPSDLSGFKQGDKVRVTGVASQFNRSYQLLAHDGAVAYVGESWFPPPLTLGPVIGGVLLIGYLLWSRERRLRAQRETLRLTYQLGEEILGAASAETILHRTTEALPGILGVTRAHLFVYNRGSKTLDAISETNGESSLISLSSPPSGTRAGAVACFHYRTLLMIPDIDRSPFPISGNEDAPTPRSLLFVPMLAQGEVTGVLELDQDDRMRDFSPAEQELAQHLANQIGVALRLLDQRSVQEQLFRTEKLAAVGRLISGVVNELQAPLTSISELANRALEKPPGSATREVAAIAAEARKGSAIVAHLVSYAAAEQGEARPVSIPSLLKTLIDFREGDRKASGIRVRDLASREPVFVLGSQGQLEQVFLNLLVHAEQSLADASQKVITIRTSTLAKRLLVEIAFSAPPDSGKPEETAAVLGVTRSVIAGHGGEVRLIERGNADPRFEIELPITAKERSGSGLVAAASYPHDPSRRMTALVIEPDEAARRQILVILSGRGYRVVPVDNSDSGLDLAHRLRFDVAFCSVHAPGLNWVELSERMQSLVSIFILLSDGFDPELSADFEGDGRFVLAKPMQEPELERILGLLERPLPVLRDGTA